MKTLAIIFSIAACSVALSGCALPTPTTGVVLQPDDQYTVTRQGRGFWVSPDSLKTEALREATEFCTKNGKKLKFIRSKETPAGPQTRWDESEVWFKCE